MKKLSIVFFLMVFVCSCTGEKAEDIFNESENLKKDALGLSITNLHGNWNAVSGKKNPFDVEKIIIQNRRCMNTVVPPADVIEVEDNGELEVENDDTAKGVKTTKDWSWGYNWQTGRYDWGYYYNPTTRPDAYNPANYRRPSSSSGEVVGVSLREPYEFCIEIDEGSESEKSYTANETVTTPIGLRIAEMDDREDLYLIREVGDKIYLDICECLEKECSDSKISSCYERFKKLVDSKAEGMFYKVKTSTAEETIVPAATEDNLAPVESGD